MGIEYNDVKLAAETLVQQGQTISVRNIRSQLGNTGSLSTISKYLALCNNETPTLTLDETPIPDLVLDEELPKATLEAHKALEKRVFQLETLLNKAVETIKTLQVHNTGKVIKPGVKPVYDREINHDFDVIWQVLEQCDYNYSCAVNQLISKQMTTKTGLDWTEENLRTWVINNDAKRIYLKKEAKIQAIIIQGYQSQLEPEHIATQLNDIRHRDIKGYQWTAESIVQYAKRKKLSW